MDIGIIGAGKVGCSIGRYVEEQTNSLTGYYSKTFESAKWAADFTATEAFAELTDVILTSDTLWITTPDDEIKKVWDCIAKYDIKNYIICHFSGSLSSDVFSGIEKCGAHPCSIHPIFAFSDKNTSFKKLNEAFFTIEGDDVAVSKMTALFSSFGNKVIRIDAEKKAKYHAAASMVSNHVLGVIETGMELMTDCGFAKGDAYKALAPLIMNNVANGLEMGATKALTGPIERNDVETIEHHLAVLSGNDKEIYKSVGKKLVSMSKEKHPDRNYDGMNYRFR